MRQERRTAHASLCAVGFPDILRRAPRGGTIHRVNDDSEETRLILQALFTIKAEVHDIHRAIFGGGNDVEGPEEEDA